jgi:Fur family ferric uptake transcriptional regulator
MRQTKQRETIHAVLSTSVAPLSVAEILARAREAAPEIGIATVYRHLSHWLRDGELVPVEITGEVCRYELAGKAHHHHFLCRHCGRVFELPGCVPGLHSIVPEGFVPQNHQLTLYGACRSCAAHKENTHAN